MSTTNNTLPHRTVKKVSFPRYTQEGRHQYVAFRMYLIDHDYDFWDREFFKDGLRYSRIGVSVTPQEQRKVWKAYQDILRTVQ